VISFRDEGLNVRMRLQMSVTMREDEGVDGREGGPFLFKGKSTGFPCFCFSVFSFGRFRAIRWTRMGNSG
jgi:hypothetical protein